jgi:hypothetical protein
VLIAGAGVADAAHDYLAPYLSSQVGFAADVMPQDKPTVPIGKSLDSRAAAAGRAFAELRDLPAR